MNQMPSVTADADSPISLANHLIDEMERGMIPVWPTTMKYAEKIVEGLLRLHSSRPDGVSMAFAAAPDDVILDWQHIIAMWKRMFIVSNSSYG